MRIPANEINELHMQFSSYEKIFHTLGFHIEYPNTKNECICRKQDKEAVFKWGTEDYVNAYFCHNCGNEIIAKRKLLFRYNGYKNDAFESVFGTTDSKKIYRLLKPEIQRFIAYLKRNPEETCPCCGIKLLTDKEYFYNEDLENALFADVDKRFHVIKQYRTIREHDLCEQRISQLLAEHQSDTFAENISENLKDIKNIPSKLNEYLYSLIKLEKAMYFLTQRLPILYKKQIELERLAVNQQFMPAYEKKQALLKAELDYENYVRKIEDCKINKTIPPVPPAPPNLEVPNLFNKKKVLAHNEKLQSIYENDVKNYQKQLLQYEKDQNDLLIKTQNEAEKALTILNQLKSEATEYTPVVSPHSSISTCRDILTEEINDAENLLKLFAQKRNVLYQSDIIFGKYRNLIALFTFYEYLTLGKCQSLDGINGAYHQYETAIQTGQIIKDMSQITENMNAIMDTQYLACSELQIVNNELKDLNDTLNYIFDSI